MSDSATPNRPNIESEETVVSEMNTPLPTVKIDRRSASPQIGPSQSQANAISASASKVSSQFAAERAGLVEAANALAAALGVQIVDDSKSSSITSVKSTIKKRRSKDAWKLVHGVSYKWNDWRLTRTKDSLFIWCDAVAIELSDGSNGWLRFLMDGRLQTLYSSESPEVGADNAESRSEFITKIQAAKQAVPSGNHAKTIFTVPRSKKIIESGNWQIASTEPGSLLVTNKKGSQQRIIVKKDLPGFIFESSKVSRQQFTAESTLGLDLKAENIFIGNQFNFFQVPPEFQTNLTTIYYSSTSLRPTFVRQQTTNSSETLHFSCVFILVALAIYTVMAIRIYALHAPKPTAARNQLLSEIHNGARLKKAVTNDRSAPKVGGKVAGEPSSAPAIEASTSKRISVYSDFSVPRRMELAEKYNLPSVTVPAIDPVNPLRHQWNTDSARFTPTVLVQLTFLDTGKEQEVSVKFIDGMTIQSLFFNALTIICLRRGSSADRFDPMGYKVENVYISDLETRTEVKYQSKDIEYNPALMLDYAYSSRIYSFKVQRIRNKSTGIDDISPSMSSGTEQQLPKMPPTETRNVDRMPTEIQVVLNFLDINDQKFCKVPYKTGMSVQNLLFMALKDSRSPFEYDIESVYVSDSNSTSDIQPHYLRPQDIETISVKSSYSYSFDMRRKTEEPSTSKLSTVSDAAVKAGEAAIKRDESGSTLRTTDSEDVPYLKPKKSKHGKDEVVIKLRAKNDKKTGKVVEAVSQLAAGVKEKVKQKLNVKP